MNKKFWNDAAKWGLLIGVIMGASRMVEYNMMLSGEMFKFALLTFEWLLVAIVYVVVLYQAVRTRAVQTYDEKVGFSFSQSLNYAMIISMFASVIVAFMTFVYIKSVVGGYDVYLKTFIDSALKVLHETEVEGSIVDFYTETFDKLQSEEVVEPTIFTTLLSTLSTYIMSGVAAGIVVSIIVKRKIKNIFSNEQ